MTRHTNRKWVLASLLVVLLLSAMESTVVTTAMKTIVAELGGIEWMSLVFSVYLLVTAVSAPIYGKLADQYGRRRVLLSAVALFVLGSVLCGLAATMPQLVLFRAVQALGAGAVFPLAMTVVGDLYTTREQTKIQAVVNSVWALSSIVGPLVGGLLAQFADWRWVFFVNVPLGLLSLVLIALAFRETYRPVVRRVDWGGALSFLISVTSLLIVLLIGGERGFRSPAVLVCAALLALSAFAFTALSRRNSEPFLPLELFRNRLLVIVNLYSFLAYAFPIAATMFIPLWLQTVQHQSPVVSGYAVAMATIGWPLGSAAAAALLKRLPPGRIVVPGTGLLALCGGVLAAIPAAAPVPAFLAVMLAAGFRLGLCRSVLTILMQHAVENRIRGIAMSTNALMNTLGQAVFAAVFGAVFNAFAPGDGNGALAQGVHAVFIGVFAVMALTWLLTFRLPDVSRRNLFGDG